MANKKHKTNKKEKKLELLSLISFIFGFSNALLLYVTSDYFSRSLGSYNISSFYFVAYVIALIGLLNLHKLIKIAGKANVFFLFFMVQILCLVGLITVKPSFAGIMMLMSYIVANYFAWVVLDIIIEQYSEDKKSGQIRGLHLMIMSAGVLIGPFFSTSILSMFDFNGLFVATLFLNMVMLAISFVGLKDVKGKFRGHLTVKDIGVKVFTNKDVLNVYMISLALEAFYALMIIYVPLYLLNLGLTWQQLGIAFTVMLVPFVVIEYPIGRLADKKYGEKEMIIMGLILMMFSTASIFFVHSTSVAVWSVILLMTRIGAATVEVLRDSYFYKKIDGRDVDLISFFRTTRSVAYLFAMGISAMMLTVLPMKFVFLLVSFSVFCGLYPAIKLVDNKSEAEMELEYEKVRI